MSNYKKLKDDAEKQGFKLVPSEPRSRVLTIRMTPDLHSKIRRLAAESDLSMNQWCVMMLEDSIKHNCNQEWSSNGD